MENNSNQPLDSKLSENDNTTTENLNNQEPTITPKTKTRVSKPKVVSSENIEEPDENNLEESRTIAEEVAIEVVTNSEKTKKTKHKLKVKKEKEKKKAKKNLEKKNKKKKDKKAKQKKIKKVKAKKLEKAKAKRKKKAKNKKK